MSMNGTVEQPIHRPVVGHKAQVGNSQQAIAVAGCRIAVNGGRIAAAVADGRIAAAVAGGRIAAAVTHVDGNLGDTMPLVLGDVGTPYRAVSVVCKQIAHLEQGDQLDGKRVEQMRKWYSHVVLF